MNESGSPCFHAQVASRQAPFARLNGPPHGHFRSSHCPVQRQLQLHPGRGQSGAQPAGRLAARPRRGGARLFAQGCQSRFRPDRRSGRPAQCADAGEGPRRIPPADRARRRGEARPRDVPAQYRPPVLARSFGARGAALGAGPRHSGARQRPHPVRDLSALLQDGVSRTADHPDPAALLQPLRCAGGALAVDDRRAAGDGDARRYRAVEPRGRSHDLLLRTP